MKSRTLVIALAALLPLASVAQQRAGNAAQRPAAPAQQAPQQQDVDPNSLVAGALQVADLIDKGQAGEVWDGASVVAKQAVTRERFITQTGNVRAPLGAPQSRVWVAVSRQVVTAQQGQNGTPPGTYASVSFATRFASGQTRVELVSFRLDEATWRVAGYAIQ